MRQGRVRVVTDASPNTITTRRNQGRPPDDLDSVVCAIELAIERTLIRPFIGVAKPRYRQGEGDVIAPSRPAP